MLKGSQKVSTSLKEGYKKLALSLQHFWIFHIRMSVYSFVCVYDWMLFLSYADKEKSQNDMFIRYYITSNVNNQLNLPPN